jgi:signal transduction histidine kinase
MAWTVLTHGQELIARAPSLIPWLVMTAVLGLMPSRAWHSCLAPDVPVYTAAALLMPPLVVGLVFTLGAFDWDELRRDTTLGRATFNRCGAGISAFTASVVAHSIIGDQTQVWVLLPAALAGMVFSLAVNVPLVATALALREKCRFLDALEGMRPGAWADFLITIALWAILAATVSALYVHTPYVALLGAFGTAALGRQVLTRSQTSMDAERAYRNLNDALSKLTQDINRERSDERRLIAADLHDEVMQPLFHVGLMARVLVSDLERRRYPDIEADLPQLLTAAEGAAGALRELIGDLRRSTLGRGGLTPAMTSLVRLTSEQTRATVFAEIEQVSAVASIELAVYQIAKEALSNSIRHSKASNVWIELGEDASSIRLMVRDDGQGFDPQIEHEGHFGLHIMRERARLVGGTLFIDSSAGSGCQVTLLVDARSSSAHDRSNSQNLLKFRS